MENQRMDGDEQEALFHPYYVQSPFTVSLANTPDCRNQETSSFLSTFPFNLNTPHACQQFSRFTLSRYSSSHGSNNSFLHEKKVSFDLQSHENVTTEILCKKPVGSIGEEEEEDDGEEERRYGILSFGYSSSWVCFSFQLVWRLVVSLVLSLLLFFIVTRPSAPKFSVKMAGIQQFGLAEGIDNSGVVTKILTSNCSLHLDIENRSRLFALHIRPPTIEMAFGHLSLASSQGQRLFVGSNSWATFPLYVGTKNKAMYGAGRNMQDLLESGKGLPLLIQVRLRSSIPIVSNLIKPKYHHQVHCLLFLFKNKDGLNHTPTYNSTCSTIAHW